MSPLQSPASPASKPKKGRTLREEAAWLDEHYPPPEKPTMGQTAVGDALRETSSILQAPTIAGQAVEQAGYQLPAAVFRQVYGPLAKLGSDIAGRLEGTAEAIDPAVSQPLRGGGAELTGMLGAMGPHAAGAALTGGTSMLATGPLSGMTQNYWRTLDATGDPEKAIIAGLGGAGIGYLEAAGLAGPLNRLDKMTGGGVVKRIMHFALDVGGESAQEVVSAGLQAQLFEALSDQDVDMWAEMAGAGKGGAEVATVFKALFGIGPQAARSLRKLRPRAEIDAALEQTATAPLKEPGMREVAAQLDAQQQIEQPVEEAPVAGSVAAPPLQAQAETTAQGATPPVSTPDVEREISEVQEEMRGVGEEMAEAALAPDLKRRADYDPLTGALRRDKGINVAGETVREARREGKRPVLLFGDFDNFKAVNTTFGTEGGDEALRVAAQAMQKALRSGEGELVRWGGDEFTVPLKVADEASAEIVRDRLEKAAQEALDAAGYGRAGDKKIGVSVGWTDVAESDDLSSEEGMKAVLARAEAQGKKRKAERGVSQAREAQPAEPGATGMAPTETQAQPAPEKTTGIKNRTVEKELEEMGLPPVEKGEKKSDVETHARAKQVFEKNPEAGADLVTELQTSDRAVSDDDVALLTFEANKRIKAREKAEADFNEDPSEANQAKIKKAQEAYSELADVVDKAGTKTARALRIRRMMVARDYSLAAMERSYQVAKGGDALTERETRRVAELHEKLRITEEKLTAAELKAAEKEAELAFEKLKKDAGTFKKRKERQARRTVEIEQAKKDLDDAVKSAGSRMSAASFGGLDPRLLADMIKAAGAILRIGGKNFAQFADDMVARLGEAIRPYLKDAWEQAQGERRKEIAGPMKEKLAETGERSSLSDDVNRIAEELIASGEAKTRDELIDRVHEVLKEVDSNISRRDAMDALSRYGQWKPLSKDEVKKKLRTWKGEMQQLAKIEDLQQKIPPKKTGVERREPSDEERRLIKEVNAKMRELGIKVTDPETQLKSALDSAKTRMRNEITDLDRQIKTGQRDVKGEAKKLTDPELEALRKRRDALKQTFDEVFAEQGPELPKDVARLQGDIDDLSKRIATGDVAAKGQKQGPDSPWITKLKEERAALQERLVEARKATPEEQTKRLGRLARALEASIKDLERRIAGKDLAKAKKKPSAPELDALRAERDARRAELEWLRRMEKPQKSKEELALKQFKARQAQKIADLRQRMTFQDFGPDAPRQDLRLDDEATKIRAEAEETKKQFEREKERKAWQNLTKKQKAIAIAKETVFSVPRALKSSWDVSAPFRQGLFFSLAHPIKTVGNIGHMLRALVSEKHFQKLDAAMRDEKSRPLYTLGQASKLFIADIDGKFNAKEENFNSRFADKIPGVRPSNRAFATFLNLQRTQMFDSMVRSLSTEPTLEQAQKIARFVNIATGRGDPGKLAGAMEAASMALWSPRLLLSRIQLAAEPAMLLRGNRRGVRMAIAKEYARALVGLAGFYGAVGLAKEMLDLDDDELRVSMDPRSTDFGKIRMGNTRLDPLGGFAQLGTLVGRVATRESVSGAGAERKLSGGDVFGVGADFLRKKFNPVLGTATDLITGTNVVGEEVSLKDAPGSMYLPLSFGDIADAIEEQGVPKGTALGIVSMFGMGLQTYEPKKPKKKQR